MELLAVAHLAQDVFKEELMEERDSAAVDAAQTVDAYWEIADVARGMPESTFRSELTVLLQSQFGNAIRGDL